MCHWRTEHFELILTKGHAQHFSFICVVLISNHFHSHLDLVSFFFNVKLVFMVLTSLVYILTSFVMIVVVFADSRNCLVQKSWNYQIVRILYHNAFFHIKHTTCYSPVLLSCWTSVVQIVCQPWVAYWTVQNLLWICDCGTKSVGWLNAAILCSVIRNLSHHLWLMEPDLLVQIYSVFFPQTAVSYPWSGFSTMGEISLLTSIYIRKLSANIHWTHKHSYPPPWVHLKA